LGKSEKSMIFGNMDTYSLSAAAIFGALAAVLSIFQLAFNFPIIPYLRFELAEIPVVIGFLIYGPAASVISSIIYFLVLMIVGQFAPVGPILKLASVLSMLLGMWLGTILYRKMFSGRIKLISLNLLFGTILRVVTLTVANYLILWTLVPVFPDILEGFLSFASFQVNQSIGLVLSTEYDALFIVLIFTAVFNIVHVFLSVLPSFAIAQGVISRSTSRLKTPWLEKYLKK
jgi:riboflavin transporter FmnP